MRDLVSYPTMNYRVSTVILLHASGGRRGVNGSNSVDTRVFGNIKSTGFILVTLNNRA